MATGSTVQATGNAAFGTVGSGQLLIWLIDCLQKHALVTPSNDEAMMMAALMVPFFHWFTVVICNYLKCETKPAEPEKAGP